MTFTPTPATTITTDPQSPDPKKRHAVHTTQHNAPPRRRRNPTHDVLLMAWTAAMIFYIPAPGWVRGIGISAAAAGERTRDTTRWTGHTNRCPGT